MIMAFLPGGGYRICLVDHERIKASQADLPGSRQPGRASADDHDMLIHGAPSLVRPASGRPQVCVARLLGLSLERLKLCHGWLGIGEHAGER